MARWKTTQNILTDLQEVFEENWMDRDTIQTPPTYPWPEKRPPRVEEIDIWEVITEGGGGLGVYAAWCPYAELYIVTLGKSIIEEFSGWQANARLEAWLQERNIHYPKV